MSRIKNDVIVGLVFMVFAVSLHFIIIPNQVESMHEGPIALSPGLFCHIIAFLLLLLSISLVISGLKSQTPDKLTDPAELKNAVLRGGTAIFFSILYIIAMNTLGYFTSTVIFMAFFLRFSGVRSLKGGIVFLTVILPFIYVLFVMALKVILPTGFLI